MKSAQFTPFLDLNPSCPKEVLEVPVVLCWIYSFGVRYYVILYMSICIYIYMWYMWLCIEQPFQSNKHWGFTYIVKIYTVCICYIYTYIPAVVHHSYIYISIHTHCMTGYLFLLYKQSVEVKTSSILSLRRSLRSWWSVRPCPSWREPWIRFTRWDRSVWSGTLKMTMLWFIIGISIANMYKCVIIYVIAIHKYVYIYIYVFNKCIITYVFIFIIEACVYIYTYTCILQFIRVQGDVSI